MRGLAIGNKWINWSAIYYLSSGLNKHKSTDLHKRIELSLDEATEVNTNHDPLAIEYRHLEEITMKVDTSQLIKDITCIRWYSDGQSVKKSIAVGKLSRQTSVVFQVFAIWTHHENCSRECVENVYKKVTLPKLQTQDSNLGHIRSNSRYPALKKVNFSFL